MPGAKFSGLLLLLAVSAFSAWTQTTGASKVAKKKA
jgi:hypothetical protein